MLAELLPKIAAETQAEQPYRVRPSLAGPERCLRQLVYMARGEKAAPLAGRALLVFDDSSWHEELTLDWLRKSAYQVHSQQMEVETRCGKGHIDGIVTDMLGVDYLLEHKALNHFGFERLWNSPQTEQWPLDYFTQVALYLDGLRADQPELRRALLLVKNKNTAQYLEFSLGWRDTGGLDLCSIVRSDGETWTPSGPVVFATLIPDAVERFSLLGRFVAANTLPDRPYAYGTTWPCGYCRYAETCWEGYVERVREGAVLAVEHEGLASMLADYWRLKATAEAAEKEIEALKGFIRTTIDTLRTEDNCPVRSVKCGRYSARLQIMRRSSLDKSLIPPEILQRATSHDESVVLYVTEGKA